MDTLAKLGDIYIEFDALKEKESFFDKIDSINDTHSQNVNYPNPAALVKKNRLSNKLDKTRYYDSLAWGTDTLRSLYILPEQYKKAHNDFGSDKLGVSLASISKNHSTTATNRLSQEEVQKLELELDGYYMPFYFHDLRTNEIITFHAFIENVNDSFDVDWNSSEGFGRIGKVYTYKNTHRKISLSFKVVAVNKLDFSEMWYKINKLVMMMYPQYTEGRALGVEPSTGGSQKFVQPFSQLISSSPIIRMRVGDLIKTNYSDIDLARLFGLGTDKFSMGDTPPTTSEPNSDKLAKLYEQHLNYQFEPGDLVYLDGSAINVVNASRRVISGIREFPNSKIKASIKTSDGFNTYKIKVIEPVIDAKQDITISFNGLGVGLVEPDMEYIKSKSGPSIETLTDTEYANSFGNTEGIRQFFNPEGNSGNPIVKSFDSVRGEGLAGVITSINFDWSEARWDTDNGFNSKAPMFGKIDLSFEVIHDINPGLDSSGMMIGAPYNIGILMKAFKANRNQKLKNAREQSSANNVTKTTIK
jgi:hypothetical protein